MPQPSPGDVHVDVLLTNLSVAYNAQGNYIASQVFPTVPVAQQSNKYRTYPRRQWFRSQAGKRAPATESKGTGWVFSTDSYFCDVWAVHHDLDDQTAANADAGLQLDTDSVNFITQQLLIRRDLEWINRYFKTGVWGIDRAGVTSAPSGNQFLGWNQSTSVPAKDVRESAIQMQKTTGQRPNVLVLTPDLEPVLMDNADIKEKIKYTQRAFGDDTLALLSAYFGVDRVVWANAVYDNSEETEGENPDAITNMNFIAPAESALLCYSNPNPGLRSVSAGYIFSWNGLYGASSFGGRVKRFRMENIASDRFEIEAAWDMKRVATDLGIFFTNVIA